VQGCIGKATRLVLRTNVYAFSYSLADAFRWQSVLTMRLGLDITDHEVTHIAELVDDQVCMLLRA